MSMKTEMRDQRLATRFYRETQFVLEPKFASLTSDRVHGTFEHLKARLLQPVLTTTLDPDLRRHLRLAANEAAAVAWTTPFPLLILPVLLEEKTAEAHNYVARQREVQDATQALVEASP
jgi:hypothetical protein